MAYDCGRNLIRFLGAVNRSLLARGDREQIQQMARAELEPGTTGLRFSYENKKNNTKQTKTGKKCGFFASCSPFPF